MQLEDHLGDIIRKACAAGRISRAVAAGAAGLTDGEFAALCENGQCPKRMDYAALGRLAGLNFAKLETIANGWLPASQDLSRWRNLRVVATAGEGLTVNCFLVWDAVTRDAALFDTGLDARPVLAIIAAEALTLRHMFITHSHWDHIEALPQFRAAWPLARLHSGSPQAPADQRLISGETFPLGSLRVTHRPTPGHAADGVTYLIGHWPDAAPPVAVVGDAIFAGSMGNGNGAWELAKQKVREQILSLPAETLICPGHGPLTTVAEENEHNPFF